MKPLSEQPMSEFTDESKPPADDNVELPFVITSWEKPSEGWLKVNVMDTTLRMTESFYWCEYDDAGNHYTSNRTWAWRQWSMGGVPSVRLRHRQPDVLSRLVREHEVLSLLADSFGIPTVAASGRRPNDGPE